MPKRLRHLRAALKETFSDPKGWLAAVLGAIFVILPAMALPSLNLLRFVFSERMFDGRLKAVTALRILWDGRLALAHDGRWPILVMAGLFGLNAALIVQYMRRQVRLNRVAGASAVGVLVGLLGVGCASCGSVFLTSLLGVGATVGALSWLPLRGQEFTWLGILIVTASIFSIAKKIIDPETCAIPEKR